MCACVHRWKLSTLSCDGVYQAFCKVCESITTFPVLSIKWDHSHPRKTSFQELCDYEYERRVAKTILEFN